LDKSGSTDGRLAVKARITSRPAHETALPINPTTPMEAMMRPATYNTRKGLEESGYYATDKQIAYLRGLMNQAFAKGIQTGYVVNDWARVSKRDASKMIDDVKRQLDPNKFATEKYLKFASLRGRL
jgi:hypothetical protein